MSDQLLKVGMILLQKEVPDQVILDTNEYWLPTRYRLWTATRVRTGSTRTGLKVTAELVAYEDGSMMKATVTFPDGVVRDPFRVFTLSARDLAFVYEKLER